MKASIKSMSFLVPALFLFSCTIADVPPISSLPETQVAFTEKEEYVIGPSDLLEINVWKEPDLTRQARVRMDGKITLPMINDIQAENKTLMELQENVREQYSQFVSDPEVTVILLQSNSRRVYMLGKVNSPGEYPLTKSMTLLQALSVANGLDRWADRRNIRLIRKVEDREQTYRIDYNQIVSGRDLSQNILLQPEDTIFVP